MSKNDQEEFKIYMTTIYSFIPDMQPGEFLRDFFNNVVDKSDENIPILQSSTDTLNRLLDNNSLSPGDARTMKNINNNKVCEYLTSHINESRLQELGSAIGLNKYKKEIPMEIANKISSDLSNILRNISVMGRTTIKKTNLDISVNKIAFNKAFHFVNKTSISSSENQTLSIYTLEFDFPSFEFNQDEMYSLLLSNIMTYVNSKMYNAKLKTNDGNIYEALQKILLKEQINQGTNSSQLNEMLLYIFLEAALNAPKIMSKIQLENTKKIFHSDGIHIHKLPTINSEPQYDIVFGSSSAMYDLNKAIDIVFDKINKISSSSRNEIQLLNEECLDQYIDNETSIKEIIIPQDPNSKKRPLRGKNAFGVFLGYTFKMDTSKKDLKKEFLNQYENDFKKAKKLIEEKIKELNLNTYSFYVYLLPLNDIAETNKELFNYIKFGRATL